MRKPSGTGVLVPASLLAASFVAGPALAQSDDSANNGGISEIIVTAQRTSQSVLDVPLSISALSGDQLTNSGIRQMSDLQLTTPGFVPSNASGYNQMFIRGIGNSIFVGADPSVATFIDDVPRVFGTLVNNFVDVERVEVIKGAPGALYGRNATGGAVNIITRQPSTADLAGTFRVSYGEKETFNASAYLNVPLGQKAAWSIAGERRSHDTYIRNTTTGTSTYTAAMFPINNVAGPGTASALGTPAQTAAVLNSGLTPRKGYNFEDFWAVSSKLLFEPSDRFKITLAADYSRKDDDNGNGAFNSSPAGTQASLEFFLNLFSGATPRFPANFIVPVTRKFTVAQGSNGFVKLKDYGTSATAVLSLDALDITSITAFRKNRSDFFSDLGFASSPLFGAHVDIHKKAFYQELRAVSTGEGPLHYIAGASFLRVQFDGKTSTTILPPLVVEAPGSATGYVVKNWSAYAQLAYDLSDSLNLMVSGRYLHEANHAKFVFPAAPPYSQTEKKFLPSATISYKLDGGGNVYARWARGFKAGGVNPLASPSLFPDPSTQGGIFSGEEVDSYEAGIRTSLLDRRVQLTTAVFYNDYRNIQFGAHARPAFAAIPLAIVNAGNARTYGAEASITARVMESVTLGAAAGYLNAKYKRGFGVAASNPVLEPLDLSGRRMINSPEWQLSFNANLDQPISEKLRLVANVVASNTSEILWNFPGGPGLPDGIQPSFWLVNARVGVRSADDRFELAVYAKNLFNEAYTTFGSSASASGNSLIWGDPRIVGAEATVRF